MSKIKTTEMNLYCNLIENELIFEMPEELNDITKYQRKKFKLISELAAEMFKFKSSRECYITISNLMILILSSFEQSWPVDKYSEFDDSYFKKHDAVFKSIIASGLR